jgi:hypothetical protein
MASLLPGDSGVEKCEVTGGEKGGEKFIFHVIRE